MSDDYFFDDDLNDSVLFQQLDAIESQHASSTALPALVPLAPQRPPPAPLARTNTALVIDITDPDGFGNDSFSLDINDIAALNNAESSAPSSVWRVHGPGRNGSIGTLQTDLHGNVVPIAGPSRASPRKAQVARSPTTRGGFGQPQRKSKHWDHTAFAKSGWRKTRPSKKRGRSGSDDERRSEAEDDSERLPAPFVPGKSLSCFAARTSA
jgi:ATP-dependent DNA helicase MPH1